MSVPYYSVYTGTQVDATVAAYLLAGPTYSGTWDLGNGVESGAVIGLGLAFIPSKVQLTVEIPSGGLVLFACPVQGTLTAGGFDFALSGLTDSINYRLHYTLIGEVTSGSSS